METAPNTGFPYFTPSNSLGNSLTFIEGPRALLALPNPFTITRTETWTVSTFIIICMPPVGNCDSCVCVCVYLVVISRVSYYVISCNIIYLVILCSIYSTSF